MTYHAINTVLWLDVPVLDLDRAITFYQAVLNTTARDARPQQLSATLQFSPQGSGLTLIQSEKVAGNSCVPYLNCHGRLDHAISQVRLQGGKVVQDKHSMEPFGIRAVITDSEGNQIALHSVE